MRMVVQVMLYWFERVTMSKKIMKTIKIKTLRENFLNTINMRKNIIE